MTFSTHFITHYAILDIWKKATEIIRGNLLPSRVFD